MRVLLTGLGSIGTRHARLLSEHERNIDLLAYRSNESGQKSGITEYTDLDEALATNPDVAFITNPTHLHVKTGLRCARAGCDLFIEKPLSNTMRGVPELLAEVEDRDLVTQMGCQLRFDPVLNRVKELLDDGCLGKTLSFRVTAGSYLPAWRPDDYRQSYSADPGRGGGVVLDLVHELDYSYWLFGPPKRITSELRYPETLDIESEGIAEAVLTTEGGLLGSIHLDYCRRQPQRKLDITCADGSIIADLEAKTVSVERPDTTETESFEYDRDRRFRAQLDEFLQHVEHRTKSPNDIREGREVLAFALQLKENASND